MSDSIKAVSSQERLVHARRIMIDSRVGRLPVIDGDELVGMMTSKRCYEGIYQFQKKCSGKISENSN